jgi:hypothetical protein
VNEQQESTDSDFIKIHCQIKKYHYELLKKIDPDNQANALRIIFDEYIKDKRQLYLDKFLTNFAMGMVIFGIGVVFQNIIIQVIMYAASGVILGYSTYQFMKSKLKYNGRK